MTSHMNRKRPLPISDLQEEIQDHYYHQDQESHPQEESQPPKLDTNNGKRRRRASVSSTTDHEGLLTDLSGVLDQIRSTQISGEIPAESLESLKMLMLQIEHLSSDVSNTEARNMKHESERQLEQWFDDLLEQCEAEGGLDLDYLMNNDDDGISEDEEEDTLALALALMDEEEQEREERELNITSPSPPQQHLSDTNSETTAQEIDVVA